MSEEKPLAEELSAELIVAGESAERQAIKAIARSVAGLAAECGKNHLGLVKHVDELLDGPAPVAESELVEAPKAETVVHVSSVDAPPVASPEAAVDALVEHPTESS
jgi:hypothetical protein